MPVRLPGEINSDKLKIKIQNIVDYLDLQIEANFGNYVI